jgi:D-arabinose 1-dehydrogenase-like Zn-dependent alcohol dehydrogenase
MPKMRAVQVPRPKSAFELVDRELPEPGPGHVRVRVQACGICHSDSIAKEAIFPGISYPRVPGHEVAGIVDALGPGVQGWKTGERAGIGWHGGHCGVCDSCRRGDFVLCQVAPQITGLSFDGGYADYLVAPAGALARIPEGIRPEEAAPLLCAGVTTFNSLRHSGARPGDLVAVLGVGGLGHLGIQFAAKMGFRTVALARGPEKGPLARKLGAQAYIDSRSQDPALELTKLGGARVILSTVTSGQALSAVLGGLGIDGTLIVLGAAFDPIPLVPTSLIRKRQSIAGWPSGSSIDSQDTLAFSVLSGVRPMIETFPLERAPEAYDHMMKGEARFRAVLTTGA